MREKRDGIIGKKKLQTADEVLVLVPAAPERAEFRLYRRVRNWV